MKTLTRTVLKTTAIFAVVTLGYVASAAADPPSVAPAETATLEAAITGENADAAPIVEDTFDDISTAEGRRMLLMRCSGPPPKAVEKSGTQVAAAEPETKTSTQ